jgi:hypothetical protein
MKKKETIIRELYWFFGGIIGGVIIFIYLYSLLDVDIHLGNMAAGAIVTLVAMYVVRLTFWVFKKGL